MMNVDISKLDVSLRIQSIEWAELPYRRPRIAGKNARLDTHGWGGTVSLARVKIGDVYGFGWCTLTRQEAEKMVGLPLRAMFCPNNMLKNEFRGLEFPLLDALGHLFKMPVFQMVAKDPNAVAGKPFAAPVYDTTIYFDELDIADDRAAIEFICSEVAEGLKMGHTNFKVKVGRCGMWMDVEPGLRRDIEVVHAIRKLIGPTGKLMVDANNGYNLNLTKQFLSATKDDRLHWLEEAFHEDDMLYTELNRWMRANDIRTMIADGEGHACPVIVDWAKKGLLHVLQYDLRGYGFFNWMELSAELAPYGVLCAPHNYGGFYGNYAQVHFAACTDNFAFTEFDVAQAEGIDASSYRICKGQVIAPVADGFGLALDDKVFRKYCTSGGWIINAPSL